MKQTTRQRLARIKAMTERPELVLTSICLNAVFNVGAVMLWPSTWTALSALIGAVLIALDLRFLIRLRGS